METTINYKNHTIDIIRDQFLENPFESFDLVGNIAYKKGSRYILGNKPMSFEEMNRIENSNDYITLPVYAYIHSGVTIRTYAFDCSWDSGQSGIVYIKKTTARDIMGWKKLSPQRSEYIRKLLRGTVNTYNDFLEGNVFGFSIKNGEGEELDSCWGFYGNPEDEGGIIDEAKRIVDFYIKKHGADSRAVA